MYPWQSFILGLCEHLAWPALATYCIIYYRHDIRKLLPRLKKLPGGAELNPETVEEQKESKLTYDELLIKKSEKQTEQETYKEKAEDK